MSNPTTGIRYPSNLVISSNTITQNAEYGIYCTTSNSTISANNISANGWEGIIIDECVNVTASDNNIVGNSRGLLLRWWGPFYVFRNNITDMGAGVVFGEYCSNSTIYANNIANNSIGVQLENVGNPDLIGNYNTVYNNNIADNYQQVNVNQNSDVVSWDKGEEGNYWSDYKTKYPNATEIDSTGIGNTPYFLDTGNIDSYPLVRPVDILVINSTPKPSPSVPEFQIWTILLVIIAAGTSTFFLMRRRGKSR